MIDQEQFQQHAENLRREIAAHNDRIRAAGHTPPALPTMTGDIVLDTEALSDHERKLWKEYHLGETDRAEAPTPAAPVSFSRDYNQPFAGDNSAERPLAAQLAGLPEEQRTAFYRAHRSEIIAEESTALLKATMAGLPKVKAAEPPTLGDSGSLASKLASITDPAERTRFYQENREAIHAERFNRLHQ